LSALRVAIAALGIVACSGPALAFKNLQACDIVRGEVAVGATPRDGEVVFWVRDNGCGISADDVSHLFDRFWQARKSDRRGAGLGLPIVKGLVEAHGGHIWVESTPGRGTTVFFTVPAATHPADQHREPVPQAP